MPAIWNQITAGEIIIPIGGTWISGGQKTLITGLSTDSRKTGPGELFLALRGDRFDGHEFISKAIESGAAGAVVQKDLLSKGTYPESAVIIAVDDTLKALGDLAGWWRYNHDVTVVAITGSAGKTTTKEMTSGILEMDGITLKSQGNFNNLVGLPLTLLKLTEEFQNTVLEMGMNREGEISRLTEIANPDVGVITNVGMAHLEGLGSLEGVAGAKTELIKKISSKGKIIINGDNELLVKTASGFKREMTTFGLGEENDVVAVKVRDLGLDGISFFLKYREKSRHIKLKVHGLHNVYNALAAAAVGTCLNVPSEHVIAGLESFSGIEGRLTVEVLSGGITLVDDTYNANPLSLKATLDSLEALKRKGGRIIIGLGEMMELGDATGAAHLEAGRLVAGLGAHSLIAIGEHAREVINGAKGDNISKKRAVAVQTREEMLEIIKKEMDRGDLVLLKGSRKMGLGKVADGLREINNKLPQ